MSDYINGIIQLYNEAKLGIEESDKKYNSTGIGAEAVLIEQFITELENIKRHGLTEGNCSNCRYGTQAKQSDMYQCSHPSLQYIDELFYDTFSCNNWEKR